MKASAVTPRRLHHSAEDRSAAGGRNAGPPATSTVHTIAATPPNPSRTRANGLLAQAPAKSPTSSRVPIVVPPQSGQRVPVRLRHGQLIARPVASFTTLSDNPAAANSPATRSARAAEKGTAWESEATHYYLPPAQRAQESLGFTYLQTRKGDNLNVRPNLAADAARG